MKKPTTKIHLKGVTLEAGEGYELLKETPDTVTVIKQGRYVYYTGTYRCHIKDTVTDKAVPLEDVLRTLNKHGVEK